MDRWSGIQLDNIIVMPATLYYDMEPVTPDKIKDDGGAVEQGRRDHLQWASSSPATTSSSAGSGAVASSTLFYAAADPRYVNLFVDTAQHCIASVDPVEFYAAYADRVTGFHFKDTRHVDQNGDYRHRPDSEIMAPTTASGSTRWGPTRVWSTSSR